METSVSARTVKGTQVNETLTFMAKPTTSPGVLHGVGQGVLMAGQSEIASYTGEGIGRLTSSGGIKWCGAIFYSTSSTTVTPKQAIQKLIHTIDNMHLSKGTTTSLEAPLNEAVKQLNRENDVAACNLLNAFLHQVDAKETNGQLTSQQAANLRQQALSIQNVLGCSSSSAGGISGSDGDNASSGGNALPLPH